MIKKKLSNIMFVLVARRRGVSRIDQIVGWYLCFYANTNNSVLDNSASKISALKNSAPKLLGIETTRLQTVWL